MTIGWRLGLFVFLLVMLAGTQYRLWVGKGSLADLLGLQQEISLLDRQIDQQRVRNREIRAEVADLGQAHQAIEERARGDLGMIKPNEVFVRTLDDNSESDTSEVKKKP